MVMTEERLLTVEQVAERLQIHPETVRGWLRKKKLRGMRMSDRMGWRIPESEVQRLVAEALAQGGAGE